MAPGAGARRSIPGRVQRVLDVATGTGMVAYGARAPAAAARSSGSIRARRCWTRARARLRRRSPELAERVTLRRAARPSGCRSPTASSTRLTFTYLLRYVDDRAATMRELARVVQPGRPDRDGGVRRAAQRRAAQPLWRVYTRVGLPVLGRFVSRGVVRGRALPRPEHRGAATQAAAGSDRRSGARPGSRDVHVRRMSFGAGRRDVGCREGWPTDRAQARATRVLRAAPGRLARPRHAAAPAVHGLAPELRGARRGGGADAARRPAASPRSARSSSPSGVSAHALDELNGRPLRHPAFAPDADRARRRWARWRGRRGDRRRGRDHRLAAADPARARRARCSCSPTTSSSPAGASTPTSGSRVAWGGVPGVHRLLRQRPRRSARRACWSPPPAAC